MRRGAGFPKRPQERKCACHYRVSDPTLSFFVRFQASVEMKVCGERVSTTAIRRLWSNTEGPRCTLIVMVNEASLPVMVSLERPGLCSACSARSGQGLKRESIACKMADTNQHVQGFFGEGIKQTFMQCRGHGRGWGGSVELSNPVLEGYYVGGAGGGMRRREGIYVDKSSYGCPRGG